MLGLQAVINVPTRIYKETKSATDQIILNPQIWGLKQVLGTAFPDHFSHTLHLDHDSLQQKNLKQNNAIHKYIRATNEKNIDNLNYLLAGEDWGNVYQQHAIDTAYKVFIQTLTYYFDTVIPLRKKNINQQIKK